MTGQRSPIRRHPVITAASTTALAILLGITRWRRAQPPGLGRVGKADGYTYRYATRGDTSGRHAAR